MSDKGGKPSKGSGPSGVKTQSGGDVVIPDGVRTQSGGDAVVCNQQKLVLDSSIFHELSSAELHALKIIQLEFAHAVSQASAAAYEKLIAEFRRVVSQPVTKPEKNRLP